MRKFIYLVALLLSFSACTERVIELPPPDFKTLIVEAGQFKGMKIHGTDLLLSRETTIKVKNSPQPQTIIFEETFKDAGKDKTITYNVTLGEAFDNAVMLTIEKQNVDGKTIVGLPYEEDLVEHGYYIIKDSQKKPVNNLTFKAQYSSAKWAYDLYKQ